MLGVGLIVVALVLGLIAFDRLVGWVLPVIGPFMPNDLCGPEGWLMDTQHASGIFDRPAK